MSGRPADGYIDIWLEQVRRERKRNPFDGATVDFDTWEAMLVELKERRAQDLTSEEINLLRGLHAYICENLAPQPAVERALAAPSALLARGKR